MSAGAEDQNYMLAKVMDSVRESTSIDLSKYKLSVVSREASGRMAECKLAWISVAQCGSAISGLNSGFKNLPQKLIKSATECAPLQTKVILELRQGPAAEVTVDIVPVLRLRRKAGGIRAGNSLTAKLSGQNLVVQNLVQPGE